MQTKLIEILDQITFIPCLAIKPGDEYLFGRAAYKDCHVILLRLIDLRSEHDPNKWGDRTMRTAHLHLVGHWDEYGREEVLDVEFLLGEVPEPKESERCTE